MFNVLRNISSVVGVAPTRERDDTGQGGQESARIAYERGSSANAPCTKSRRYRFADISPRLVDDAPAPKIIGDRSGDNARWVIGAYCRAILYYSISPD